MSDLELLAPTQVRVFTGGPTGESFVDGARRVGHVGDAEIPANATDDEIYTAIANAQANSVRTQIAQEEPFRSLEANLRDEPVLIFSIPTVNTFTWGILANFGGAAVVADGADLLSNNTDALIGTMQMYLQAGVGATKLRFKLYRRSLTDAAAAPDNPSVDTLLRDMTYPLEALGMSATGPMVEVDLNFAPIVIDEDHSYLTTIEAYDDTDTRCVLGFGNGYEVVGKPVRYRGYYRSTASSTGWSGVTGGAIGQQWLAPQYLDVHELGTKVDKFEETVVKLDNSFTQAFNSLALRPDDGTYWGQGDAHFRWVYGVQTGAGQDIPTGLKFNISTINIEAQAQLAQVKLRVWKRPTNSSTYGTFPGNGPNDTLLFSVTKSLSELGLTPTSGSFQLCQFAHPEIIAENNITYLFEWVFLDTEWANTGAGITRTSVSGLTQQQRGFYDGGGNIASPLALSWQVGNVVYSTGNSSTSETNQLETRDYIGEAAATATGYNVAVSGSFVRGDSKVAFSDTVVLQTPTVGDVVDESRTLTGSTPHRYFTSLGVLAYSNVSNVTVKDASTSAALAVGTEYLLEPIQGVISAVSGTERAVKVSYHWSKRRYDLIYIHAETKVLGVVTGQERDRDTAEFLPKPSASYQIPLFYARVADGFVVELFPVWYLDGNIHRDLIAGRNADYENQRRALKKTLALARSGQTVRVAAMGDSIGAQESGYSPNNAPNTPARDRPGYFAFNIGADRIAQLPLYDQGDGAGQAHTRTSTPWSFCLALASLGANVEYYNFCIGGTASGPGERNGGDPVLRAAMWATNPHVLVTHYGMNETGSDDTEANLRNLFDAAFSRGIECFAIGMPRPGAIKPYNMTSVRKTWRATRRAAEFYNSTYKMRGAYFAPERLVDDPYMGAMGMSNKEYGAADGYHHPGIHECETYGNEIHVLVCGE